jgi:hypothetical protein
MNKLKNMKIFIFTFILLTLFCNSAYAYIWISPMKIIAEEKIIEGEYSQVEKFFTIRNDDNVTLIVEFFASDINITFLNDTIELLPFEKKNISVIIHIQKGIKTGKIFVKAFDKIDDDSNSGINIQTSMVITVTTNGLIDIVDKSDESFNYINIYILILMFVLIAIVLYIYKNKKKEK